VATHFKPGFLKQMYDMKIKKSLFFLASIALHPPLTSLEKVSRVQKTSEMSFLVSFPFRSREEQTFSAIACTTSAAIHTHTFRYAENTLGIAPGTFGSGHGLVQVKVVASMS
jgi:hypothetical protein